MTGRFHLGITQYTPDSTEIIAKPLVKGGFRLVFSDSIAPQAKGVTQALRELSRSPYISFGRSDILVTLLSHYELSLAPREVKRMGRQLQL